MITGQGMGGESIVGGRSTVGGTIDNTTNDKNTIDIPQIITPPVIPTTIIVLPHLSNTPIDPKCNPIAPHRQDLIILNPPLRIHQDRVTTNDDRASRRSRWVGDRGNRMGIRTVEDRKKIIRNTRPSRLRISGIRRITNSHVGMIVGMIVVMIVERSVMRMEEEMGSERTRGVVRMEEKARGQ